MRAVVLGGRGFLGRHAVAELERNGFEVEVAGVKEGIDLASGPQSDVVAAVRRWAPDVVVNATGRTSGALERLLRDNVVATDRLLRSCALVAPGVRLVHLASAAEYGPSTYGVAVQADDVPRPVGDYGRTKLAATRLVLAAGERGAVDPVVLRVFNPLGAGQPPGTMSGSIAAQLAQMAQRVGESVEECGDVVRVGRLDAWRDYVSAVDVGRAVLAAATVRAPARRLVNVGSGRATSVRQVATELIRLAGGTVQLEEGGDVGSARSGEVSWQQADVMATRDTLAWSPHDTLLDAANAVLAGAGVTVS